jgi:hypothetical protein
MSTTQPERHPHVVGFLKFAALCVEIDAANDPSLSGPIAVLAQRYLNGSFDNVTVYTLKALAETVNKGANKTVMVANIEGSGCYSAAFTVGIMSVRIYFSAGTDSFAGTTDISIPVSKTMEGFIRFTK